MSDSIVFAPEPDNIFRSHIDEYYERTKEVCPQLEAICGKWEFEDLIPGLSDFDTRFFFSDDVLPEQWPGISRAVGKVHADICREDPGRARILEHLPGINLKWEEALESSSFYPEFKQWTIYRAPEDKKADFEQYLESRPWDEVEELFNVKKFALYFTPYDRNIDPPINLKEYENKYPLHSRIMHYFCPPLQSSVCLKLKRMVRGKTESFRLARDLFPNGEVIDLILDIIGHHYEVPEYYVEPLLYEFETKLFEYLQDVLRIIQQDITVIEASPDDTSKDLKEKLSHVTVGVWNRFFDGAKFCRLMMGRLNFYAEDIPHFDSIWLIKNELNRIRRLFFETTFSALGMIMWGVEMSAGETLERCRNEYITEQEYAAVKAYADAFGKQCDDPAVKTYASEIAGIIGPFQVVLDKLIPVVHSKIHEQS